MYLLVLDANRPSFHSNESSMFNLRSQSVRGFVSYPTDYYSRPPRPTDYGRSRMPHRPTTVQSEPKNSFDTSSKNVQQGTSDNPAKVNASDQCTDVTLPASTSATSGTAEQLQWKAGEGPSVELRLLVPGKVL